MGGFLCETDAQVLNTFDTALFWLQGGNSHSSGENESEQTFPVEP